MPLSWQLDCLSLCFDFLRLVDRNPIPSQYSAIRNAGTLEWLTEVPGRAWGVRSIPEIDSRYPLWDQPNFIRDVDQGKFYLPDAEEGERETLVTSTVDANIVYCLRVPGPTWLTLWAAIFTAGVFIAATYHWWWTTIISGCLMIVCMWWWLWTGTARIPEKAEKDVGLGVIAPLYVSGPQAVGWWAMFITMLGDMTAYLSLVFAYFFYWTIHTDFPPPHAQYTDRAWLLAAAGYHGSLAGQLVEPARQPLGSPTCILWVEHDDTRLGDYRRRARRSRGRSRRARADASCL